MGRSSYSRGLAVFVLVGCGSSAATVDASLAFGPADAASSRDARSDRTTLAEGGPSSRVDSGTPSDARVGADDAAPLLADGSVTEPTCGTPCSSTCTGSCLAGRCYDTVVSGARIVNNISTIDSTSLYWLGVGLDGGVSGYTIRAANKLTGASSVLASSTSMPQYPEVAVEPVAGQSLNGTFFTTTDTASNAGTPVFAASGSGTRLVYGPGPDAGYVSDLSVSVAGLLATVDARDDLSTALLRLSFDGGAPATLYSFNYPKVGVRSGLVTSSGEALAWILEPPDAQAAIMTGSLDGGASLTAIAEVSSVNAIGFFGMDAHHVYWSPARTAAGITTIFRAPVGGGTSETFLTADNFISIAVDASDFYWTQGTNNATWSVRRTSSLNVGAAQTILACVGSSVSVDSQYIYLTNTDTILRTTK